MSFSFASIGHIFADGYSKLKAFVGAVEPIIAKVAATPGVETLVEDLTAQIPVAGPTLSRIEHALIGNALAAMQAKAAGKPVPDVLTADIEAALQPVLSHLSPGLQEAIQAFEAATSKTP